MAKGGVTTGTASQRMKGQRIVLGGKFGWGVKERLEQLAKAQGATVEAELSPETTHLVLADLGGNKTLQKKMNGLIAKGAGIQLLEERDFEKLVRPSEAEMAELLRGGKAKPVLHVLRPMRSFHGGQQTPEYRFVGEDFRKVDLSGCDLTAIEFVDCRFDGATLGEGLFATVTGCSFETADCKGTNFVAGVERCSFRKAILDGAHFSEALKDVDFSDAQGEHLTLYQRGGRGSGKGSGLVFRKANLPQASFNGVSLDRPDFASANLQAAVMANCSLEGADLRSANLTGASLIASKLKGADLRGADLTGANLADADLTGATLDKADVAGANLRGAKLDAKAASTLKNFDSKQMQSGSPGPSAAELDKVTQQADRIQIEFRLAGLPEPEEEAHWRRAEADLVTIDSHGFKYGWGLHLNGPSWGLSRSRSIKTATDALLTAASVLGHGRVRFETVSVKTTKSPASARDLTPIAQRAIAEIFDQPVPEEAALAELTKAYREEERSKTAAQREKQEKAKKKAAKAEEKRKKEAEATIRKEVGAVTDIATFLKALELRLDKGKIAKATKMLKAEGFKLYNDVDASHMSGVVKSQSDPDLVYACRITNEGDYACCTQNLNICGGLRGSVCKHLLVLIIGLVKAGELDPGAIDGWVAKSNEKKAALDKETMGEIFIRYKGAEAGEVDWRPTETLPEDYYAL